MNTKNSFNLITVTALSLALGLACGWFTGIAPPPQQSTTATPVPATPTAAQSPTPDEETEKLKEKIEELEKKIEDRQRQTPPTIVVKPTVPVIRDSGSTAWVNSPGDGFLALRSEPNAETGYRILKIPHGASVRVLGCRNYSERVGGRTGRWCRVSYAGYAGWAFDGWLVY
jgi:hypothetical protein